MIIIIIIHLDIWEFYDTACKLFYPLFSYSQSRMQT